VVVKNATGTSDAFTVEANEFGPAFFTWPGSQAVATRQDYSLAIKDGSFAAPLWPQSQATW
jgi:uncharacterized protein (TIGR03437 family)